MGGVLRGEISAGGKGAGVSWDRWKTVGLRFWKGFGCFLVGWSGLEGCFG